LKSGDISASLIIGNTYRFTSAGDISANSLTIGNYKFNSAGDISANSLTIGTHQFTSAGDISANSLTVGPAKILKTGDISATSLSIGAYRFNSAGDISCNSLSIGSAKIFANGTVQGSNIKTSLITFTGGNTLVTPPFGMGQEYTGNIANIRIKNNNYFNNTLQHMYVLVTGFSNIAGMLDMTLSASVGNVNISKASVATNALDQSLNVFISFLVPPSAAYSVDLTSTVGSGSPVATYSWYEFTYK
jgi:hypothetical protein